MRKKRITLRRHVELRLRRARKALVRLDGGPSFYGHIQYRLRLWKALVPRHDLGREIYPEFDKLRARELAESVGVPTPELLDGPVSADDLQPDRYGDHFVIKPVWGAASLGILHLRRSADGFTNILDGARLPSADAVRARIAEEVGRSGRGSAAELIVESAVLGAERPTDWKVYTFFGEIGAILQIDRSGNGPRHKIWSPQWADLGPVRPDMRFDAGLEAPRFPAELLDAAARISLAVPTGFLRVDLFEGRDGVVAGEVSLLPGGDQFFSGGHDRRLGELWEDAEVRILSSRRPLIP